MIKMMAVIRRKPGMTQQEYFSYIRDVHGAISKANPLNVRRYIQNHVFDSAFGTAGDSAYRIVFHRDSVTELWFDSFESMNENFAHPYVREKVGPDGANFSELGTALALLTREMEVSVPNPRPNTPIKILYFLRKIPDLTLSEYYDNWRYAHESAVREQRQAAVALRRCVLSLQIPEGNPLLAYFGGKDMPIYEGVASLWYEENVALSAFREYQAALETFNHQRAFFDPGQSFFLMAREVTIIG
jgi:hypothetical protein